MSEAERVTISVAGGVADVRLNRPEKLNALDPAMFDAIVTAGERLAADKSVRAVVISGEGRGFCAGLDVATFQAVAAATPGDGPAQGEGRPAASALESRLPGRVTNRFQEAVHTWTAMPAPVIAAVHGVALGGGAQIALGADLRIVAPDARISILEIRWGLVPDMTGTEMLGRLVRPDVAKELTWTGRMVSGEEAVALGLATRISDRPREDALVLARDLASRNPDAIQAAKRLLNQAPRAGEREQFLAESRAMAGLLGSPNQVEAIAAHLDGRPPAFADPE
jgi:enoyl-CoA hydratase/carnithine racemase